MDISRFGFGILILNAAILFQTHSSAAFDDDNQADEECDFVIIGAGTGGLALAARLAEVEDWDVCVLERGPKERSMSGWYTNSYKWTSPHDPVWLTQPTLRTLETQSSGYQKNVNYDGRMIYIPRWRGQGGTSRVYGAIVRRASPAVLNLWPKGWQNNDLLPYYKKSEDHYCYYDTEESTGITAEECEYWHGKDGPMQVNPQIKEVFSTFPKQMQTICEDTTMPWNGYAGDYNGPPDNRISCSTFQQFKDRTNKDYIPTVESRTNRAATTARGSSYTGYYKNNTNPNQPRVILDAPVTKILFNDSRAIGVLYLQGTTGKTLTMRARKEVIVAGGALDTPHLLQISGVGPRDLLKTINVDVVGDNPHVGQHLWDHISVPYVLKLSQAADGLPPTVNIDGIEYNDTTSLFQINGPFSWIMHFRSKLIERGPKDMSDIQLYVMGNSSLFDETAALCTADEVESDGVKDYSSLQGTIRIIDQWPEYRGSISATTSSIFDKPVLDYGWDYKLDNNASTAFKDVSQVVRDQIRLLRNIFFGKNVSEPLGELILDEVQPGLDKITDEELNEWMRGMLVSALHPACTCKMPDCVDGFLKVKTVSNLRVCDTSAFATQVDGNPVATLFAMSEKLADVLKNEYLDNIHLALRQDWAMNVTEGKKAINFTLPAGKIKLHTKCKDVHTFHNWIETGKDTSALIIICTLRLCETTSPAQAIVDNVALDILEEIGQKGGGAQGYPLFNRPEAILPNNKSRWNGSRSKPLVFVVWRQLFPHISSEELWGKVGHWSGNPVSGDVTSFKLNCQPRVYMELHHYSGKPPGEMTYIEKETNFPAIDYIATKKVVNISDGNSSAFFRTASMIAEPNINWYSDVAEYLLEEIFASSGRRYAQEFPPLANRPGWWYKTSYGLLIYQSKNASAGETVAGFDLDNTVIKTRSGDAFPQSTNDWMFTSPSVPMKFQDNHKKGTHNVILTNQKGISLGLQDKNEWMQKLENVTAQLDVPLYVVAATEDNEYRKPKTGMWTYFNCTLNQFKTIKKGEAVYVGDVDSDKEFAEAAGITFKNETYFST